MLFRSNKKYSKIINIDDFLTVLEGLTSCHIENLFKNQIIENELLSIMIKSLLHLLKLSSTKIQKEFTLSTPQNQKIFLILSSILSQFKFNTDIEIIMHNLSTSLVELIYSKENLIKNLSKFLSNLSSLSNSIINELLQTINKEKTIEIGRAHV